MSSCRTDAPVSCASHAGPARPPCAVPRNTCYHRLIDFTTTFEMSCPELHRRIDCCACDISRMLSFWGRDSWAKLAAENPTLSVLRARSGSDHGRCVHITTATQQAPLPVLVRTGAHPRSIASAIEHFRGHRNAPSPVRRKGSAVSLRREGQTKPKSQRSPEAVQRRWDPRYSRRTRSGGKSARLVEWGH